MNVDASWLKAAREEARRIAEEVLLDDAWPCMTIDDHALLQADACSGLESIAEVTSSHFVLPLDIDIWIWVDLDWFGLIRRVSSWFLKARLEEEKRLAEEVGISFGGVQGYHGAM